MTISPVNYSLLTGSESVMAAEHRGEASKFADLLSSLKERKSSALAAANGAVASSQVNAGAVNGEFISSRAEHVNPADKASRAQGVGASIAGTRTIDKTSELYAKAQELETFMVKQMLSSMRKTVNKGSLLGGEDFASKMYEDMMFDEYAQRMTRSAGFGLSDAVYLQLTDNA